MPLLVPVIAAIGGALVAALAQVYLARRAKSGTIANSEAAEVWAARKELTDELHRELKRIRDEYKAQSVETDNLRQETSRLRVEMSAVREEAELTQNSMALVRKEAGTMRIRMMDLERQLDDCRRWLADSTREGE